MNRNRLAPTFCLVTGSPCAGKTTICKHFSSVYKSEHLTLDYFVYKRLRLEAWESPLSDQNIESALLDLFDAALASEQNLVLIDVAFHDIDRLIECTLIAGLHINLWVYVTAPEETIYLRNLSRPCDRRIPESYLRRCQAPLRVDSGKMQEVLTISGILPIAESAKKLYGALCSDGGC